MARTWRLSQHPENACDRRHLPRGRLRRPGPPPTARLGVGGLAQGFDVAFGSTHVAIHSGPSHLAHIFSPPAHAACEGWARHHHRRIPGVTWLALLLQSASSNPTTTMTSPSALEGISFDHGMVRYALLAVPAATWRAIEAAMLGPSEATSFFIDQSSPLAHTNASTHATAFPRLRTLIFSGYDKYSFPAPDVFMHFSSTVRERLARLEDKGMLRVVR
ncbi:hypothetical protein C8R43DRAFT_696848 [Mycena crocata]|nr:hypothetical protein C8R43DRAFT_696848 [Mycena crocata]